MEKNRKIQGNLSLRLKPHEAEALNKIIEELNVSSASQAIVSLFNYYERYNILNNEFSVLKNRNEDLVRENANMKQLLADFFAIMDKMKNLKTK